MEHCEGAVQGMEIILKCYVQGLQLLRRQNEK
jgi:hypothetical protein